MVHWMKKREKAHPFERLRRKPFKIRYVKEDPTGIALSLVEEGKLNMRVGTAGKRQIVSVSLPKPKQWYRKFF